MKASPEKQKLDHLLRSSELVADGFMGRDKRFFEEVIEADEADGAQMGYNLKQIADRMSELTALGKKGLGTVVQEGDLDIVVNDNRGTLPCPWPHPGRYMKTVTAVTKRGTDKSVLWSDLSIHFIEAHGFFQGIGSAFRLDPKRLIETIF